MRVSAGGESDRLIRARELHRLAVAQNSADRPAAAQPLLRQALRAVDGAEADPGAATLRVQILITLAKAEAELRGSAAGLARLDEASTLFGDRIDPQVAVALQNQRGVLAVRSGNLRAALDEFDKAERYLADATPLERANILLNGGSTAMLLGDYRRGVRDLHRCAEVARAHHLTALAHMSLHNLGYLEFLRGDIPQALRLMSQADSLRDGPDGVSLLDRARVLAEAGLIRDADDVLGEAAELLRRTRVWQDLAETELERARCALVAGDPQSARRFAGRARDRFRRRGNHAWQSTAELVLLQADLAAGRPPARLVGPALRVQDNLVAQDRIGAARTAGLIAAEATLLARGSGPARELLATVGGTHKGDPISARMHVRLVDARIDMRSGRDRRALGTVRTGLAELAAYQASFGSIDLQAASAVHGRRLAELGIAAALERGRAAEIFDMAERARAVSTRLPVVQPPKDPAVADLLMELRQTVESLRAVQQDRTASATLVRRRQELENAIAGRRWTLAGAGDARPVPDLDAVHAGLGSAGCAMAMFLEVAGALHAIVISPGGSRVVPLGPSTPVLELARRVHADLDALARPMVSDQLAAAVRGSFDRSVRELDARLVMPLLLGGDRVVVVSTGVLGQLPWGALPSLRGVPVVVAPSATTWLTGYQSGNRSRRRSVAVFAGPDLPRAHHEVAGVGRAWGAASGPGPAEVADRATRGAVSRAMSTAGIVHVAAHGVHQTDNPLFSSLRLSDGVLFAHELDQTRRAPDHVVLSSCELGLATVRPGDEALGLTSVLLRLGTRSVVAGVARVSDDVAADAMIAYHRRLAAGMDTASALAEVTAAAPAVAPFVCFGAAWRPPGFGAARRRRVP